MPCSSPAAEPAPAQAPEVSDLRGAWPTSRACSARAPIRRPARQGRRAGPLARRAGRRAGQARARRQGAREQIGSGQEMPQELIGAAHQARGHAGGHVGRRALRPVAAAGGPRRQARRAAKRDPRDRRDDTVGHRPLRPRSCPPSGPRPAGSAQRLDGLKGEVDERCKEPPRPPTSRRWPAKLAALEQDLQGFIKSEADRSANATRVLLTLELANLKRAIDRGERYADELAQVKKVAGTRSILTPLERYTLRGRADAGRARASRSAKAANAMLDAEAEPRRRHARRPAAVGRALDRARAQGRATRRRHQRRGHRRPHGGSPEGRPARRGAGATPRSCRPRPHWPARTG